MKTIIFSFLVWSAIVIRSPIRAAVVLSEDIKDLLPQQNSVAWKESLFVWRIPQPSFNRLRSFFLKHQIQEDVKLWRGEERCKHWVSLSPTFKSLTPLIFYFWVEDPEEEEESQDAGWPGHWCRDNVSLWEMERHQFSPDWLHHRQNILNFVIFRITPCQCQQSHPHHP